MWKPLQPSESTTRMALALSHGSPDYGAYLNEARTIADSQQLDFLEFVDSQGTIISSAQWPAKFGYKETLIPASSIPKDAFLKQEELPDGAALGLFAVREVEPGGENAFRDRRPPPRQELPRQPRTSIRHASHVLSESGNWLFSPILD